MRRPTAVAAAMVAALFALWLPTGRAVAAPISPKVSLLGQTAWVETQGNYQLQVGFSGAAADDQVEVSVFPVLITRTAFDEAADGQVSTYTSYHPVVPISALPVDAHGGYDINLPINTAAPAGSPFTVPVSITAESSGVFPVQVQLLTPSGATAGKPLTTFLVFSDGSAKSQGYSPLSVALVVPFSSTPQLGTDQEVAPPGPVESNRLEQLATDLNDTSVSASVLASPVTLQSLATGAAAKNPTDEETLDALTGVPSGGQDQILPSTYSPVSVGDLSQSLPAEVEPQLDAGRQTLQSTFSVTPASNLWVVDGPLDDSTMNVLLDHGANQLIVPDADLTALSQEIDTTFTHATALGYGSSSLSVYAADSGLTADFTRDTSPVLAANILLADLAMVFTESPGETYARGIVAMPPAGWTVSPTFIATVLAGLDHNPLVTATTASSLFTHAGYPLGTRYLADPQPAPSAAAAQLAGAAPQIAGARQSIENLAQVLPSQSRQLAQVRTQILVAESETLTTAERQGVLDSIEKTTAVVDRAVTLPPDTSITLTSTKGQLPITILTSGNLHPRVELRLKSQRLIFRSFQPADGSCRIPTEGVEVCTLTLKTQNTTVVVPVETRSSGVFPLDVGLYPPAGATALVSRQYTVRSTAVSGAAIVIIVAGLAGLAIWWVRDLRRGRRPKGLVPAPEAEPEPAPAEFDEFFDQPPPEFGPGGMSPSAAVSGLINLRGSREEKP